MQPSMDIGLAVNESHQAAGYAYKTMCDQSTPNTVRRISASSDGDGDERHCCECQRHRHSSLR